MEAGLWHAARWMIKYANIKQTDRISPGPLCEGPPAVSGPGSSDYLGFPQRRKGNKVCDKDPGFGNQRLFPRPTNTGDKLWN